MDGSSLGNLDYIDPIESKVGKTGFVKRYLKFLNIWKVYCFLGNIQVCPILGATHNLVCLHFTRMPTSLKSQVTPYEEIEIQFKRGTNRVVVSIFECSWLYQRKIAP